jgi:Protein kinase domain
MVLYPLTVPQSSGFNRLVLFQDGCWKLADFGLTSEATSNILVTTSKAAGRNAYRAPELLVDEKAVFNNKADMWALGCIVFELFSGGKKAFSNDFEVYQYGKAKKTPYNLAKQLDSIGKYYLQGLLECDPNNRPSSTKLLIQKFAFASPNIPAEHRPKKRKLTDRDVDYTEDRLADVIEASIEWSASNALQHQIFRSLLEGASEESTFEITWGIVRIGERDELRPQLSSEYQYFRMMEKALAASDILTVSILLRTLPLSDDRNKATMIEICRDIWTRYIKYFMRARPPIQRYDYVNLEALQRLALGTSDVEVIQALGRRDFDSIQLDFPWTSLCSDTGGKRHRISTDFGVNFDEGICRAIFIDGDGKLGVCLRHLHGIVVKVIDPLSRAELPQFRMEASIKGCGLEGFWFQWFKDIDVSSALSFNSDIVCYAFQAGSRLLLLSKNLATGDINWTRKDRFEFPTSKVQLSPDTRCVSATGLYSGVKIYTIESGGVLKFRLQFDHPRYWDVVFSCDGNFGAALGSTIRVLDLRRMCAIYSCVCPGTVVQPMAFHPSTNNLCSIIGTNIKTIWGPDTAIDSSPGSSPLTTEEPYIPIDANLPVLYLETGDVFYPTVEFCHDRTIIATTLSGIIRLFSLDSPQAEVVLLNQQYLGHYSSCCWLNSSTH